MNPRPYRAHRQPGLPAARRAWPMLALCAALTAVYPAHAAHPDLTSLSLESLMQLTVVGASKYEQKQQEVAAAVNVITRSEIQAHGWRTLDAALASLPGVHTTYDRQYTYLGMRGFGLPGDYNTRTLIAINGNRVNDAVYDGGPMGRQVPIDMDLVERIEFIPGPGGAVYGQNAMFGVVNIVTRDGAGVDGTEIAAAVQSPQRLREGRLSWGRRLDNGVEVLLSARALRARGEDRYFDYGAAGVSGVAAGLDGERDSEIFARVTHGAWSFDLVHGDRRKDDPTGTYLSDPLVPGQYQSDRYLLAQVQYQERLRDDTLHVLGRLFTGREDYNSHLSYGSPYAFPATGQWNGGEIRLLWTALADHKLMVGLELQRNAVIRQEIRDLDNPSNDIVIAGSGSRSGVYLQDEWRFAAGWLATLGVRVDHNTSTGSNTSPRAALIWQAGPGTTLKALYGRAH